MNTQACGLKTAGLCYVPSLDKEATLALNPRTRISLKHPMFRDKVQSVLDKLHACGASDSKVDRNHAIKVIDQFLRESCNQPEYQSYTAAEEVDGYLSTLHGDVLPDTWVNDFASRYALAITYPRDIPCTCHNKPKLRQVLPIGVNTGEVICYETCARTLFSAFKRQNQRVLLPDTKSVHEFHRFCDMIFDKYLREPLKNFDYSYSEWFNSMPRRKQDAILRSCDVRGHKGQVVYGLMNKCEKQEAGGKTRAIANIDTTIKYILGPVCWALESLMAKNLPGYCGNKSWDDLEKYMTDAYNEGYQTVLQGDGSAFDTCQHDELKYIDRLIYNFLVDNGKIHHVDPELFRKVATSRVRKLDARLYSDKMRLPFATSYMLGTVFSGSSDTTLMNTVRMSLYNMFTMCQAGLKYGQDFKHLAKGDDFMVFVRHPDWNGHSYQQLYDRYWVAKPKSSIANNYQPYGIGMILKFLLVGDYSTIDFCSTTAITWFDQGTFHVKLARRPDRMDPLSHWSRAALTMSPGQYKQYLIDQAWAINIAMPDMPFYRDYANAMLAHASVIKAEPTRLQSGLGRLLLPDDGHAHTHKHERSYAQFEAYGRDFVEGVKTRQSTTKPPENAVYHHLLTRFGITYVMTANHARFLICGGLYDDVAGREQP